MVMVHERFVVPCWCCCLTDYILVVAEKTFAAAAVFVVEDVLAANTLPADTPLADSAVVVLEQYHIHDLDYFPVVVVAVTSSSFALLPIEP